MYVITCPPSSGVAQRSSPAGLAGVFGYSFNNYSFNLLSSCYYYYYYYYYYNILIGVFVTTIVVIPLKHYYNHSIVIVVTLSSIIIIIIIIIMDSLRGSSVQLERCRDYSMAPAQG